MLGLKPPFRRKRAFGAIFIVLFALALASCEASDQPVQIGAVAEGPFTVTPVLERLQAKVPVEYAFFGSSVAVSGDTVVVGAWGEADRGRNTGAVYVFQRGPDGLTQRSRLVASDAAEGARFGHAVAIHEDTLLVGAIYHGGEGFRSGAVYVFERTMDMWVETGRLNPQGPAPDAYFGSAVALHEHTTVIGAHGPGARAAYVFERSGSRWFERAILHPSDSTSDINFGSSVAIHSDSVVVGAWTEPREPGAGGSSHPISAYVFEKTGESWLEHAVLAPFDGSNSQQFGYAVAISDDTVAIGAPGARGAVYLYQRSGPEWVDWKRLRSPSSGRDFFGVSVAIGRDIVVVGAPGSDRRAGAAYLFTREGDDWHEQLKLVASQSTDARQLGIAIAVDERSIALGATGDPSGGTASGAVYSFDASPR